MLRFFAWHQMIEAYLRDSGIAWTNLHPNMFMQNFLSVWSIKGGLYSAYTSKAIGFTALEDVAEAAAVILMEGPEKHSGMDYWFSVEALTPHQVAETLTAVTGRKFTAAVHHAEGSKTMRRSLVQHSNQRMQREDSNCSARSRTEEWRTLEA
jgi:NAD(P)H dehydrogenase (quinone)